MNKKHVLALMSATAITVSVTGMATAGGLERGGYNVDLLFDPAPFAGEVTGTYVMPNRKLNNVKGGFTTENADGIKDTEGYWVPRVGLKANIGGAVDCMVDYSQPWGVHTNPGSNWAGSRDNIETKIDSNNYAATCSYKMDAGKGQFRVLGGVFYQDVSGFKLRQVAPNLGALGSGVGRLDLEGDGVGWRIGAAYEIPDVALRASLVYNSAVKLDNLSGTVDLSQIPGFLNPLNPYLGRVTNVVGNATMPESVEFKLQSGIAPDWLAFGSVKWVNWSRLQSVDLLCDQSAGNGNCFPVGANVPITSLDLLYRDGWTVSAGLGHKFNEQWSGSVALTWDRGTTTGLNAQTDSWTVSGGVAYQPTQNVELRVGGALGVLTSGSAGPITLNGRTYGNGVTYDFDNDLVSAISTTFKVKW